MKKEIIEKIVMEIVEDICDRRGLSDVWDEIDEDIQEEIKNTWCCIIANNIEQPKN